MRRQDVIFGSGRVDQPSALPDGLGPFDAIVTLQAAHETRHKRHLVPLLERARTVVAPGGVLLYADHY